MLDINFIRKNPEIVKKAVTDKGIDLDVDKLLKLDVKRRQLIVKVDELRKQRNQAAHDRNVEKGKQIKKDLDTWDIELKEADTRFNHMMLFVPNIPAPDSPLGLTDDQNVEVYKWGEIPRFDFKLKDHIELGKILDIIDLEQGTKVAGFRGYYLKNEGAILHLAILNFAFDKIVSKGFAPLVPPSLVHEDVLIGSGHLPFGKDNIYQITNPGKLQIYLTGTSEPSLLAYYMNRVVPERELPIKICAMTHCYRSEVGDYGKDTRGLYRVHEFDKVEQLVICQSDLNESEDWFKRMQQYSEQILQELKLPYRVINVCTGDMGAGKYKMYDIETWMPSRQSYGETHSNSNLTDWQARRLNLKVKSKDGKTLYPYTLNNTVIASPRILIAILENFQQSEGSVKIPEALTPYTNFKDIRPK